MIDHLIYYYGYLGELLIRDKTHHPMVVYVFIIINNHHYHRCFF